jgi:sugar O-acyltransferase (sialic acid O-acetyltransferase NeuD family)
MTNGRTPAGLYVLGFGGHARSVADVAVAAGIARLVFVDENAGPGETFADFPAVVALPASLEAGWQLFPASGDGRLRQEQVERARLHVATLIAPTAYLGLRAEILPGAFIAHRAHVGPAVRIGRGTIVNTGAQVDHESVVGDFSHVSVNATVAGRCRIGQFVMVGAGATVIDRISICDDVMIGAGATVVRNITEPGTYVGTPARRLPVRD